MACNEYESDEVPRRVREDKEKRTKDGAQGQHKLTSRGSKKKPAKEMEKDSQGSRRKTRRGWEQRGERVSRRRE